MASYTMQLREYIESFSQDEYGLSSRQIIEKGRPKLFDFDYPFFDPDYKNVFETNFIRNFYMREIGFETEGLFKFQLETWMLINMPYYNKLFESELIKFNPLESYSLKTTYQRTNDMKKDDNRKTQQQDSKNIQQNDQSSISGNESDTRNQNDTNTHIGNDRNVKNQNDSRDITQNDETTLNQNGNTVTDATGKIIDVGNRESLVDNETNNENETNRDLSGKTTNTTDNFERKLESDTPDTRLAITTNDGEGVIQYASKIDEQSQNNKDVSESDSNEKQNDVGKTTSSTTSNESNENQSDSENHSDTSTTNEESGSLDSKIKDSLTSNVTDTIDRNSTDSLNSSITGEKNTLETGSKTSNITDELTSNLTDNATSKINDVEDYIEEKVGSIGVKTYPQMITEYREALLRIEKEMFKEMNQLFMLVY